MTTDAGVQDEERRRVPTWLGPTALMLVSGFFIGVVIWGFLSPVEVRVVYVDAGPATSFRIAEVTAFPDQDLYIVGMEDGRLRAIDGRVDESGCSVVWMPDDLRGRSHNPRALPGVFEDPCSGAVWSMIAHAISGSSEPLRTPHIDYRRGDDGATTHAFIEHINP
ncbi:MAG: hypothetical protein DWG80_03550 [Chloroflexi bacterium]|nr:hypothetical protein [Chloroflexota bacterium]MQC18134.1 hypothetical protein [Chloroflexota bacterium]